MASNLEKFQENINDNWVNAPETIEFKYRCYSMIYYQFYDDIKHLENSNKIIMPNKILNDISIYNDVLYPLHFTINDSEVMFTPSEFKEDIKEIYIPQHFIDNLGLDDIDKEYKITLVNKEIKKGTRLKIKPHSSDFLEIQDYKQYLEKNLLELYTTLTKNQTLLIPYFDKTLMIDILECDPNDIISIIDTDIEVDIETPWDYVKPKEQPIELPRFLKDISNEHKKFKLGRLNFSLNNSNNISSSNNSNSSNNSSSNFTSFSGVGRTLYKK